MKAPSILGIVNATPDSFSDGGDYDPVAWALRLLDEGADAIDVGGESTRPGAAEVGVDLEMARVVPVITEVLRARPTAGVWVDTRRASVAEAAIAAGATVVNDVSAGADPQMFHLCARLSRPMVLMHMRGTPATMQAEARYTNVCAEVWAELAERERVARSVGVPEIILDPGLGFAKTAAHNLALLRNLPLQRSRRVLVGASRKSFIGAITRQDRPRDRIEGSLAVALFCMESGVEWVRVHDVAATRRAFLVRAAIAEAVP